MNRIMTAFAVTVLAFPASAEHIHGNPLGDFVSESMRVIQEQMGTPLEVFPGEIGSSIQPDDDLYFASLQGTTGSSPVQGSGLIPSLVLGENPEEALGQSIENLGTNLTQVGALARSGQAPEMGTSISPSPVPIPTAGLMLMTALGGAAALRRRK